MKKNYKVRYDYHVRLGNRTFGPGEVVEMDEDEYQDRRHQVEEVPPVADEKLPWPTEWEKLSEHVTTVKDIEALDEIEAWEKVRKNPRKTVISAIDKRRGELAAPGENAGEGAADGSPEGLEED